MTKKQKTDINDISALVVAGAKHAWAEKEPILLIGLLEGVIMVTLFWPVVQLNFSALQVAGSGDATLTEAFLASMMDLWPRYLLMMLFNLTITVVIARLAARGRAATLAGGLPALARHIMWVLWRVLSATGWILAGLAALWLVAMAITMPLSLIAGGGGGTFAAMLQGVLVILLAGGLLLLSGATGLSLVSECADHHLSIRGAWGLLKGQRVTLAAGIFVVYLGTAVINGVLVTLMPENTGGPDDARLALSVLFAATMIVGTFFTFIWFSMTAAVAEKLDWSENEAEPEAEADEPEE
ncbi:MAG: hypothetical protein IID51_07460 [Proteobacteria bacterium]|nr:hypothetical protein [Pseudomonadota bacterium]